MNALERRLQKLEAQSSTLERQLSELRARAEIADLMGRYAVYYGAGWGERIVSELWSRDEENVSLEYGKKVILEQSFRPEDYIFSGEELLRSITPMLTIVFSLIVFGRREKASVHSCFLRLTLLTS